MSRPKTNRDGFHQGRMYILPPKETWLLNLLGDNPENEYHNVLSVYPELECRFICDRFRTLKRTLTRFGSTDDASANSRNDDLITATVWDLSKL